MVETNGSVDGKKTRKILTSPISPNKDVPTSNKKMKFTKANQNNNSKKHNQSYIDPALIDKYAISDIHIPYLDFNKVLESYKKCANVDGAKRLLLFDYDGTLTQIRRKPDEAIPPPEMLEALQTIVSDPQNIVFIISGRDQSCLEGWLGQIKGLGLSAEHGCFLKYPDTPAGIIMASINGNLVSNDIVTDNDSNIDFNDNDSNYKDKIDNSDRSIIESETETVNCIDKNGIPIETQSNKVGIVNDISSVTTEILSASPFSSHINNNNNDNNNSNLLSQLQHKYFDKSANRVVEERYLSLKSENKVNSNNNNSSSSNNNNNIHNNSENVDDNIQNENGNTSSTLNKLTNSQTDSESRTRTASANTCPWLNVMDQEDFTWKDEGMRIMEKFTNETKGSFIETKKTSITWHYRLADPDFGEIQASKCEKEVSNNLIKRGYPIEVLCGKKNVEIRPTFVNKGQVAKRLVEESSPGLNFVFCAGDDKTDEDMFVMIRQDENLLDKDNVDTFCCTVGPSNKITDADWYVSQPKDLIGLLELMAKVSKEASITS